MQPYILQKYHLIIIIYIYILVLTYIQPYLCTHSYTKYHQIPIIHFFTTKSLYNLTYVLHSHNKTFVPSFKNLPGRHHNLWHHASLTTFFWHQTQWLGQYWKITSEAWHKFKPAYPRAPICTLTLTKRHATIIVESFPKKILNLTRVTLFCLLSVDIITAVDASIIGLRYNDKHNTIVSWIKSQGNPILCKLLFKYWKPYHNFGPLFFYGMIRYEWSYSNSNIFPCLLSTKPHLIKNKHKLTN